jgi:hypothetical protein
MLRKPIACTHDAPPIVKADLTRQIERIALPDTVRNRSRERSRPNDFLLNGHAGSSWHGQ